jgi:hypothetical protein
MAATARRSRYALLVWGTETLIRCARIKAIRRNPPVLFFLVHPTARRLIRLLASGLSVAALEVKNAVLRHGLAVLPSDGEAALAAGAVVSRRRERRR